MQPLLLIACANDPERPLDSLKRERKMILETLEFLEDRGLIQILALPDAETPDLIKAISKYQDRLAWFHYAGHADGKRIRLEDQEGNATGLAALLGSCPQMAGVFLNGCATYPQVAELLNQGVPAVIATKTPIHDARAASFAEAFYQKFRWKGSIDQSFSFAKASLDFAYKDQSWSREGLSPSRAMKWGKTSSESMPWGLYFDESRPECVQWTLPGESRYRPAAFKRQDLMVNEYLIQIAGSMAEVSEDIATEVEKCVDDSEYFGIIINRFPWLISAQLKKLFTLDESMRQASVDRLEQILSTYLAVSQLVYFILLSQLWTEKINGNISRQGWKLHLPGGDFLRFDYLKHAVEILTELHTHELGIFVEELDLLRTDFAQKGEIYESWIYLESLRNHLNAGLGEQWETEITDACLEAEYALEKLLSALAFLVNYQMIAVRDINVYKWRHKKVANFRHLMGRLYAQVDSSRLRLFREPKAYDRFLDSKSVILLRDLDDIGVFLNISPFIIDKNAYGVQEADAMDLYTFAQEIIVGEEMEYQYVHSNINLFQVQNRPKDLFHTGEADIDPKEMRRLPRPGKPALPETKIKRYLILREQLEQMKEDWKVSEQS